MKSKPCFNTDCFRFNDDDTVGKHCIYADSCNGYQLSLTKNLLKQLDKEQ